MKSIYRVYKSEKGFAQIDNELIADPRLSFKAKGILCYLLSKPDSWKLRSLDLAKHGTEGVHAIYSALKELRKFGYAKMVYFRKEDNSQLIGRGWEIFEKPLSSRQAVLQVSCKTRDRYISNTDKVVRKKSNDPSLRAGSRECLDSPSFGVDKTTIKEYDVAPILVKEFYSHLVKIRHHIGRSDLPTGNTLVSRRKRLQTFKKWKQETNILLYQSNGNCSLFRRVMNWYFDHYRDEFMPSCYAITTFREKFDTLVRKMKKDIPQEELDNRPRNKYGELMPDEDGWIR